MSPADEIARLMGVQPPGNDVRAQIAAAMAAQPKDAMSRQISERAPAGQPRQSPDFTMPSRSPGMQAVENVASEMFVEPLLDVAKGVGAAATGNLGAPEVGSGMMAAMGLMSPGARLAKPGIRAFHGSPHSFDRFDISKIGTGEGAQAFGHGLYFAGKEDVAKSYRDALAGSHALWNGAQMDPERAAAELATAIRSNRPDAQQPGNAARLITTWVREGRDFNDIAGRISDGGWDDEIKDELRVAASLAAGKLAKPKGHMYEVEIGADPKRLFQYDIPFSDQSRSVKAGLNRLGINPNSDIPGREISDRVANEVLPLGRATPQNVSAALKDAGIPGIEYLDRVSRRTPEGKGTSNYVVFDDALVDILRKYGLAGAAPVAGAAAVAGGQEGGGT